MECEHQMIESQQMKAAIDEAIKDLNDACGLFPAMRPSQEAYLRLVIGKAWVMGGRDALREDRPNA